MKTACPIADCDRLKGPDQLLCRVHWFTVPKVLRDAVWRWWRASNRHSEDLELVKAHRDAARAAIEAVERIEARRRDRVTS